MKEDIEKLCELVNNKLKKGIREPGSIEYRNSTFENALVKIINNTGGYQVIINDEDNNVLIKYLKSFLKDIDEYQKIATERLVKEIKKILE